MNKGSYNVMQPRARRVSHGDVRVQPAETRMKDNHDIMIISKDAMANGTKKDHELTLEIEDGTSPGELMYPHGCCSQKVEMIEKAAHGFLDKYNTEIWTTIKVTFMLAYLAYFAYCVLYRATTTYFDEGAVILTVITGLVIFKLINNKLLEPNCAPYYTSCLVWYGQNSKARLLRKAFRFALYVAALLLFCLYLGLSSISINILTAQALIGIACMICLCFIFSASPSQVNWHPVYWGFIIQFLFAMLTLRTAVGYNIFKWIGDLIHGLVRLSDKGSIFVFGASFLADGAGFFFECAGVIVFFNACIFILEYYGILEFIVLKIGGALALCLETGPVESVVAAANIFIGLAEAPLLVRPYLKTVTKSELHAIMVCGFSSISGAFMAMFIKVGAPASHLLTAAVISAPAALAITKLMYPEREKVDLASQRNIRMKDEGAQQNALQACSDGASFSIKLVATIMVNMIAFVSLLNLVNTILLWLGERAGQEGVTFDWICSYLLYPVAFLMGVPSQDCGKLGALLGIKLVATPFVAYADLGRIIQNRHVLESYMAETNGSWTHVGEDILLNLTNRTLIGGVMQERSEVISTYALCGISAFPAIGFSMGTLIPMCPERKPDVVSLIIRAFIAGNLANIVTGSVAGVMYTGQ